MKTKQSWVMVLAIGLYWLWLKNGDWGLGFSIINFGFLALIWKEKKEKKAIMLFLYGSSALLGVMMTLRSYGVVRAVTGITILVVNIIISAWQKERNRENQLIDMAMTVFLGVTDTGKRLAEGLSGVISPKKIKNEKKWVKVISGIALSVPMLLVFLLFFSQSDPIFYKLLTGIKWPKLENGLIFDIVFSLVFGGLAGAMLKAKIIQGWRIKNYFEKIEGLEIAVMILQVLFLIFSVVQIRYFFADQESLTRMGINFSEYTRKGYGEMLFTSFLAMGVMWMIGEMKGFGKRKTLVKLYAAEILLFVTTATRKNYFYQANNGFTRVRLWGFCLSMLIMAMVITLLIKIVREKSEVFWAKSVLVLLVSLVLGLNLANIDKMVAKNPARINGKVDYLYLSGLSNDSWLVWDEMLRENKVRTGDEYNAEADMVNDSFLWRKERLEKQARKNWQNWGSWNLPAVKALRFLRENEGKLMENKRMIEENQAERNRQVEVEGTD